MEIAENLQGSNSQPLEPSSPENEQPLQLEGRDNQESELEEETEHTGEEERDEAKLPITPSISPPQDPLYEVELAQIWPI